MNPELKKHLETELGAMRAAGTFKREREGLFCARIFGTVNDYECLFGKYKRMKY